MKRNLGSSTKVPANRRRKHRAASGSQRLPSEGSGRRVLVVAVALAIGSTVIVGRAWQLQVHNGERYRSAAKRQAVTSRHVTAKRGVIKDRHGAELAITVDVDSVVASPRQITDPAAVARQLAPVLNLSEPHLVGRLSGRSAFRYLSRHVGADVSARIRALGIKGVRLLPEPKRLYPNRALGAHIIGWTNREGVGRSGIEKEFDSILRGRSYEVPSVRDARGGQALVEGFVPHAVLEGDDVVLTIDRHIQHATQVELERAVIDSEAVSGVAIVMHPRTGDILGLASYPAFNPNNLSGTTSNHRLDRAVAAVYEPGSTLKMVTIAAGLEEAQITPETKIDCENGRWKVGTRTIRDTHPHGELTIPEVLKVSSNICSAKLGFGLGRDKLHGWLRSFGLGERSGIELPGEVRGLIRPPSRWRDIALANISFGQGLSVTPLQIAQVASIIANGGERVWPRIVKATVDKAGTITPSERPTPERVVKPATAAALTKMMVAVTSAGGTAPKAAVKGFAVAGKTGTSQKIDPVTKAYSHSLYVASFVGFVPAEAPEVVVLVLIDEPKTSIYGGVVAGPAFRRIATAALSALGVYPEDAAARTALIEEAGHARPAPEPAVAPDPGPAAPIPAGVTPLPAPTTPSAPKTIETGLSNGARALLGLPAADLAPEPAETVETAPPAAPSAWEEGSTEPVETAQHQARMPNFAGLLPREVIHRSAEVNCDLVLLGTGRAVAQSPHPGAVVRTGERCEVTLSPNG